MESMMVTWEQTEFSKEELRFTQRQRTKTHHDITYQLWFDRQEFL
jgi:hypothetical protein